MRSGVVRASHGKELTGINPLPRRRRHCGAMNDADAGGWIGLAVALGCGLLVGVERERRKGKGPERGAAGLRTFAVAALTGALAAQPGSPALVAAGALVIGLLAASSYWRSNLPDPGLTTELALLATYLLGVLAISAPALASGGGTALALLLALRERLHRFATRLISGQELHDGLLLAAAALVALPLVPGQPVSWLGGLTPRPVALLFVLILGLQAVSHVALRAFGARVGWPLAGLLAGFVSSTAAVATLGRQARSAANPALARLLASAAACSGLASWVLLPLVVASQAPQHGLALLPMAVAGALATGAVALLWWRRGAPDHEQLLLPASRRVLRPREALGLAALLGLSALAVGAGQAWLGAGGRLFATAMTALADAHAAAAALAALAAAQTIALQELAQGVLLAMGVNVLSRSAMAAVAGGMVYALRVSAALIAGLAAAGVTAIALGVVAF